METTDTFVREFARHRSSLFGYILAVTGAFHTAEDLFQEVSVVAFQKADTFKPGTNFGAWVRKIAQFKMLEEKRRITRTGLPFDPEILEKMEDVYVETEDCWEQEKEALRNCLDKLPIKLRKTIGFRYGRSFSLGDIAVEIGGTPGAVQVALSRARQNLLVCIRRFLAQENTA